VLTPQYGPSIGAVATLWKRVYRPSIIEGPYIEGVQPYLAVRNRGPPMIKVLVSNLALMLVVVACYSGSEQYRGPEFGTRRSSAVPPKVMPSPIPSLAEPNLDLGSGLYLFVTGLRRAQSPNGRGWDVAQGAIRLYMIPSGRPVRPYVDTDVRAGFYRGDNIEEAKLDDISVFLDTRGASVFVFSSRDTTGPEFEIPPSRKLQTIQLQPSLAFVGVYGHGSATPVDSSDLDSWHQAKIEPHLFSQSRLSLLDESGYSVEVQRAAHEGTSLVIQVKVKHKSTTDDLTLSSGLLSLYGFLNSDGRLVGAHSQRNSPIVEANF